MNCLLHPVNCVTQSAANASFDVFFSTLASWVSAATGWAWNALRAVLEASSSPGVVTAASSGEYHSLLSVAPLIALCAVCANVVRSLRHADVSSIVQDNVVAAPLAVLALLAAPTFATIVLSLTNDLSSVAAGGAGTTVSNLSTSAALLPTGTPGFGVFFIGLVEVVTAVLLLFELIVRNALPSLLLALSPVIAAASIFAPMRRVAWRSVETFVALALAKFVVVVALGIGASAVASGSLYVVLTGVALVLIAVLAPFVLLRVVPFLEQSALHAAEGLRQRATNGARRATVAAVSMATGSPPPLGPPERPDDLGLEDWPDSGPLEFPDESGPRPEPPVGTPRPRRGHRVYTEDRLGPVLGWHFDE